MAEQQSCIESLSAVTIFTADMARAVRFYQALGFTMRYGGAASEFTSFHAGSGYLNLMHGTPPARLWGRIILYVHDVDAMYRHAVDAGLQPMGLPADMPWGERCFHLRDPDGNELSFAHPINSRNAANLD